MDVLLQLNLGNLVGRLCHRVRRSAIAMQQGKNSTPFMTFFVYTNMRGEIAWKSFIFSRLARLYTVFVTEVTGADRVKPMCVKILLFTDPESFPKAKSYHVKWLDVVCIQI